MADITTLKQLCAELKLDRRKARAPWSCVKGPAGEKEARTVLEQGRIT